MLLSVEHVGRNGAMCNSTERLRTTGFNAAATSAAETTKEYSSVNAIILRVRVAVFLGICSILSTSEMANAGFLVGTYDHNPAPTLTEINEVINLYNTGADTLLIDVPGDPTRPGAPLDQATGMIDKLEAGSGFKNEGPVDLTLSVFTFYKPTTNTLAPSMNVFGTTIHLEAIADGNVASELNSNNVVAFTYDGAGDIPFTYYSSKNDGFFSLWKYVNGFNPVYVEETPDVNDFDPLTNEVSHISFWGPTTVRIQEIPEPSSVILLGMGGLSLLGYGWRRRKTNVAA